MADFSMMPRIEEAWNGSIKEGSVERSAERTLYETPARPLHLRGDDNLGRDGASPHDACPRLDGKHSAAGHIRSSCRREHSKVVIGISMYSLIPNFTLGLFRTQAPTKRFYVRHIPCE